MRKSIFFTLSMAALSTFWFSPGLCSNDDLRMKGIAAYKAKKYKQAAQILEQALESGDGSPDCYVYLAGAHYGSGNYTEAVRRYIDLKNAFKGLPAGDHAEKILKKIDPHGKWAQRVAKIQADKERKQAKADEAVAKEVEKANSKSENPRKAQIEAKRAQVMKEARERCNAVRANIKQRIKHARANSNQWYQFSDGSVGTGISKEQKKAIQRAGQLEIERIMDDARRKARSYR